MFQVTSLSVRSGEELTWVILNEWGFQDPILNEWGFQVTNLSLDLWSGEELTWVIESGSVSSTDGRGTTGAEDTQGTPTQSHTSPSIQV